jgi:hypothetical protein
MAYLCSIMSGTSCGETRKLEETQQTAEDHLLVLAVGQDLSWDCQAKPLSRASQASSQQGGYVSKVKAPKDKKKKLQLGYHHNSLLINQ